ncbi:MAG TPA: fructosamine kinase family protein [Solirubrobacteraceae bacterium]|nr:fructosamine kinase family protein [Solirubrobacteraceae bacterium]
MTLPPGASGARRVVGGDINEAYSVRLANGQEAFVKTRADAAPGEYAAEAAGLRWLAEAGALRTPRVLDVDERYLALEWIATAPRSRLGRAGAQELGAGLAATHLAGAPCFGLGAVAPASGGPQTPAPARFGSLRLPNDPTGEWPEFYAERRLRPLALLARERGALPAAALAAVERVCERLAALCGPPEPPARVHGDLWSGNVIADARGRPWLIDPCAYGGHREVDLAMLRLFGAPSELLFAAYEQRAPLAEGWRERVELYQLLPLLVHALLFGGSYVHAAARVARRYGG